MLFDYFVVGQVIPFNPASAVRGEHAKPGEAILLVHLTCRKKCFPVDIQKTSDLHIQ